MRASYPRIQSVYALSMQTPADAEAKRAERIARQEREAQADRERAEAERNQVSTILLVAGVVLIGVGIYFLVASPSQSSFAGEALVNLHRLTIGETSVIAGVILFAVGALIRYR